MLRTSLKSMDRLPRFCLCRPGIFAEAVLGDDERTFSPTCHSDFPLVGLTNVDRCRFHFRSLSGFEKLYRPALTRRLPVIKAGTGIPSSRPVPFSFQTNCLLLVSRFNGDISRAAAHLNRTTQLRWRFGQIKLVNRSILIAHDVERVTLNRDPPGLVH